MNTIDCTISETLTSTDFGIREIGYVVLIVAFAGVIRIPSLTQPLGPDQGIMSVIGEGILHGKLPYKDFWEMASPAIFFTYAILFKIFGVSMIAVPIADMLTSMLTTLLIFLLANLIWEERVGYISALVFAFFSNGVRLGMHAGGDIAFGTFWYIAQRETFMLPLIVGSFYFMIKGSNGIKNGWYVFLSGFLAGSAFAYKFPSLFMFACLLIYLNGAVLSNTDKVNRALLGKNIAMILGFFLALFPFFLFFWFKGVLNDMTDVIFKYVYSVYGQLEHDRLGIFKTGLIRTLFIAKENFIIWIFFVTSAVYILIKSRTKAHVLIVLWGVASLLFIISHREFFGYHYLMILPPFSLLTGFGLTKTMSPHFRLRKIFTVELEKAFIIFCLLSNLAFFITLNYTHYTKFYYYITGKLTRDRYYDLFNAYPKHVYSFPADYKVAQFIKKNTSNKDTFYAIGGIESVIYFLTKRESPSRFIFSWIIFSPGMHGRVKLAEEYREELLADLKTTPPKYMLIVGSLNNFIEFSDIYHFISDNYTFEKKFTDDRFIYVHKRFKNRSI